MKQAIFMVAYFGADGRGRRHISFATTDEQERDQWLKDKGKNARYYSPVEEVHSNVFSLCRRNKSIAPPLSVGASHHSEEDLPVKVLNRRKDSLDLTFEVRIVSKLCCNVKL